jgi:glyoxylase-like metal-dependent hydrolase (beta-lactamase superfamily II)
MRAIGVHADVIVVTSRVWQTTCTCVRAGDEGFVIDSPVLPDELETLPALLEQAAFPVSGLLCTHGDWDHLLGRLAFPSAALGCAETTAARLTAEPGAAQRELRDFDEQWYVERPKPLSLGATQAVPVPGFIGIGGSELELAPADGHTQDGMAILVPWAKMLVAGDYLSPVEIPTISPGGSLDGYLATLARLGAWLEQVDTVVPGHGPAIDRNRAQAVLEEDVAYLETLRELGADTALPPGRTGAEQKRMHATNIATLTG